MQRRRPAYQTIDGVARCVVLNPGWLRKALEFKAKKGDLVQITFPKSGTHWLMYIMQFILKDGQPMSTYQEFAKEWRFLEYADVDEYDSSLPFRTFATHLAPTKHTMTRDGKYIYLARNPWDVCVSFYHMMIHLHIFAFHDGTFEDFVDAFVSGNFGYGDYFEHVAAGFAVREEPNVFFLTYEELKNHTADVALRLAYFLGEEYGRTLERDEALLEKLLERSQPDYMRNFVVLDVTHQSNPQWNELLSRMKVTLSEGHNRDDTKYPFVRSGKVGSWKEYFTPDLLRKMENRILEAEKGSAFMDLWKDIRAEATAHMQNAQ
ncbi:hypothetical protein HPB50_002415 [Hyalomma asiaticum]|uniref:Uncharacterized protein n=1 Tax=Hyalomma asiaticum TaxID=266040 RepID=A0ACB7SAK2_HYAAI|nr:hypothetical protein HPB50_002415 [Hyalomma asiaticum]